MKQSMAILALLFTVSTGVHANSIYLVDAKSPNAAADYPETVIVPAIVPAPPSEGDVGTPRSQPL